MIWVPCALIGEIQTGKDVLNNPTYESVEVKQSLARCSPWTDEQIVLEGREITRNEQQYILPIPFIDFPTCQKIRLNGHELDIMDITDLSSRYTLIRVKKYKG